MWRLAEGLQQVLPHVGVDRDAEAEVLLAQVKGLFAGVAGRFASLDRRGGVDALEDALNEALLGLGIRRIGNQRRIDGQEELRDAGLAQRVERQLVGGLTAGERGGE